MDILEKAIMLDRNVEIPFPIPPLYSPNETTNKFVNGNDENEATKTVESNSNSLDFSVTVAEIVLKVVFFFFF